MDQSGEQPRTFGLKTLENSRKSKNRKESENQKGKVKIPPTQMRKRGTFTNPKMRKSRKINDPQQASSYPPIIKS